uniref:Zinc finger protein RFP-like n=1 Tax=Podarcis muralis TaxID=64176 RepID=A0A670HWP1_PODMU
MDQSTPGTPEQETTCSICREYLTDPVTLDCGHNFCRGCITTYCKILEYQDGGATDSSCPQCRETVQQRNFRPNCQLANLVELVKKLQEGRKEDGKRGMCPRHQEPLKLFCNNDQDPICVVCDRSKEHREHSVFPMEEASQEYKVEKHHHQQTLFSKNERVVNLSLSLSQESRTTELRKREKIIRMMLNVTLYPDTAHPNLILSEDLKCVQWGDRRQDLPDNSERFDKEMFVLGRKRFTSGRHWWEVEVGGEWAEWAVSVARESVRRKGDITLNPSEGFWALQKTMVDTFGSFSDWQLSASTSPKLTVVYARSELRKIRVSLHYEEGLVEFFDGDTNNSIFAFPSVRPMGRCTL